MKKILSALFFLVMGVHALASTNTPTPTDTNTLTFTLTPTNTSTPTFTPTPTRTFSAVPTQMIAKYYAPAELKNNPVVHVSVYRFNALKPDMRGIPMGRVGLHPVLPVLGLKVPFGAQVLNVIQSETKAPFTEANPTPTANFNFGVASDGTNCENGDDDTTAFCYIAGVTGKTGMTVPGTGDYGYSSDLGVNWWNLVGKDDEGAICPDALNFSFLIEYADLTGGAADFTIHWECGMGCFEH